MNKTNCLNNQICPVCKKSLDGHRGTTEDLDGNVVYIHFECYLKVNKKFFESKTYKKWKHTVEVTK